MRPSKKSLKEQGYSMPFEGAPHQGTILLFPYRTDTWRNHAVPARHVFLELVKTISKYETVYLCVDPEIDEEEFEAFVLPNVEILRLPYNDAWARDNTLIFVQKDGKNHALDFGFNAWGGSFDGLYQNFKKDNALGKHLIDTLKVESSSLKSFILEGGSIHTDGEGTLLTTEACLLSKGRNPSKSKEEIETILKETLGMDKVLWIPHGIYRDETNEHVDNMACFLAPTVIAIAVTNDESDPQYAYSIDAIEYLKHQTDAKGRPFTIIEIPVPTPLYMTKEESSGLEVLDGIKRMPGERLAGSYINFYQSENFVLVPKFGVKEDAIAYQILKDFYKTKDVIQIESRELLLGGGNIHCVTMQIPKEEKK